MSGLVSSLHLARRLLCCAALAMLCAICVTPAQAKRTALVVGVNAYENLEPEQQLQKVNDARAVANALKDDGFIRDYGDSIYVDQAGTKLGEAKNNPAAVANNNPAPAPATSAPPVARTQNDSIAMNIPAAGAIVAQSGKLSPERANRRSPSGGKAAAGRRVVSGVPDLHQHDRRARRGLHHGIA